MAKKFLLVNNSWNLVSDDTLPAMKAIMSGKPAGSMFFGLPTALPLMAAGDQQNSVAGICQTDAEVTTQKAVSQVTNGFVIDVRGTIWTWNGTTWVSTTLTPALLQNYLRPRRFYYNSLTGYVWYVSSAMVVLSFLKKDNPFATQAAVTAGSGAGLVSPATLKNAYGSW